MAISAVGSLQSVASNGATQRAVTTHAAGNLLLATVCSGSGTALTGMTCGATGPWVRLAGPFVDSSGQVQEIWGAVVTAVSSAYPVRSVYGNGGSGGYNVLSVEEFTAGLGAGTPWNLVAWGVTPNPSDDQTLYPRLVPSAPGQLYFGHTAVFANKSITGITSGVTYAGDANGDQCCWATNVSSVIQPVANLSGSASSASIAVLMSIGQPVGTVLGSITLSAAGSFAAAATARTPVSQLSFSLTGEGSLQAFAGVAPPPPPPGSEKPPPGGGLPPGPPPRNAPTAAGLVLYRELAHLTLGDDEFGWPLRTFVDAAAGWLLQRIDNLVRDTPAGPGWSQVIDPTRAPVEALPWLGQFVGVPVDPSKPEAQQRAQVMAEAGLSRGSLAAVKAAAESQLKPGQTATITERSPDPYSFLVTVRTADALYKSYADLTAQYTTYTALGGAAATYDSFVPDTLSVKAAVLAAKPAGLSFVMVVAANIAFAGAGSLSAGPKALISSTRSFAGAGSLAAAGTVFVDQATALLLGDSVFDPGGLLVPASLTLAGAGALAATSKVTMPETATLAGAGALAAAGTPIGFPQLVQSYYVPSTGSNVGTLTTPTFTPDPGEIIVVKAATEDQPTVIGTISGGSLTYTNRIALTGSSNCRTTLATAQVGASPAAMAVSVAFSGTSGYHSIVVERWRNAAIAASPALGSSQSNTSVSQAITTAQRNSVVSWVSADWNVVNPGTPTLRSSAVSEGVHYNSNGYTAYHGYQFAPVQGGQVFGVSAPTGQKASMAGIEIQSLTP